MRRLLAVLVVLGFTAGMASADIIVQYTFGEIGAMTNTPAVVHDDLLSASSFEVSAGSFSYGTATGTTGGPDAPAIWTGGWSEDENMGQYWGFSVTLQENWILDVDSVSWTYRMTTAGPQQVRVDVWDGEDWLTLGTSAVIRDASWQPTLTIDNNPLASLTGTDGTVDFRLYGYESGGGNWAIDNVTVEGSMIPEPGTMAMLGLGIGALALLRRRMK